MDRGAWWATVHGVTKSRTWLSDFTLLHFFFIAAQGNGMTLPTLAQFPPFCEVFMNPPSQKPFLFSPVLLCFMFLTWGAFLVAQMVKNLLHCGRPRFDPWVGKIPCRREWLPTPVFLPGESHGRRSLTGYSPWGRRVRQDPVTNTFPFMFLVYWTMPSAVRSLRGLLGPCLGQTRFNMVWLIWSCSQLPNSFPSSLMIRKGVTSVCQHFCQPEQRFENPHWGMISRGKWPRSHSAAVCNLNSTSTLPAAIGDVGF